jgi:hypothetical protein
MAWLLSSALSRTLAGKEQDRIHEDSRCVYLHSGDSIAADGSPVTAIRVAILHRLSAQHGAHDELES